MRAVLIGAAALVLLSPLAATAGGVPEPSGLWTGPMHGETPSTLQGATVLDGREMATLVHQQNPAMIDVANADYKPSNMPSDMPWIPVHRSVPGATWLPGAGTGTSDPGFSSAFDARVAALTGSDKDKPIVTFCHPRRWGSWNAAKRLVALGYRHVYWFPGGAEGWSDQATAAAVSEDLVWKAAGYDRSTIEPAAER